MENSLSYFEHLEALELRYDPDCGYAEDEKKIAFLGKTSPKLKRLHLQIHKPNYEIDLTTLHHLEEFTLEICCQESIIVDSVGEKDSRVKFNFRLDLPPFAGEK